MPEEPARVHACDLDRVAQAAGAARSLARESDGGDLLACHLSRAADDVLARAGDGEPRLDLGRLLFFILLLRGLGRRRRQLVEIYCFSASRSSL